jgi:hypothetical protein
MAAKTADGSSKNLQRDWAESRDYASCYASGQSSVTAYSDCADETTRPKTNRHPAKRVKVIEPLLWCVVSCSTC